MVLQHFSSPKILFWANSKLLGIFFAVYSAFLFFIIIILLPLVYLGAGVCVSGGERGCRVAGPHDWDCKPCPGPLMVMKQLFRESPAWNQGHQCAISWERGTPSASATEIGKALAQNSTAIPALYQRMLRWSWYSEEQELGTVCAEAIPVPGTASGKTGQHLSGCCWQMLLQCGNRPSQPCRT